MDSILVRIPDDDVKHFFHWEAKKYTNIGWFKMPCDFMINRRFRPLSSDSKILYFAILTICAKAKFIPIETDENELIMYSGLKSSQIRPNLIILQEKGVIDAALRDDQAIRERERKKERKIRKNICHFGPQDLIELWNEYSKDLPKAKGLSKSRTVAAHQRIKEYPDKESWRVVITKLSLNDFCNGKNNRGWKANFDFLLRAGTHLKVLEGQYDNPDGSDPSTHSQALIDRMKKHAEDNP